MNFIDYCIATKNYSALNTINAYTKTFTKKDEDVKKGDIIESNGEKCIVMATREADEKFGTLVCNGFKRLAAGLLVAVPLVLLRLAIR